MHDEILEQEAREQLEALGISEELVDDGLSVMMDNGMFDVFE